MVVTTEMRFTPLAFAHQQRAVVGKRVRVRGEGYNHLEGEGCKHLAHQRAVVGKRVRVRVEWYNHLEGEGYKHLARRDDVGRALLEHRRADVLRLAAERHDDARHLTRRQRW